jgi:hypothetical protein
MKVVSTYVVISLLAVLSLGCSKKTEEAPAQVFEVVQAKVAEDKTAPMPAGDQPAAADVGEPEHVQVKLTPEQIKELIDPAEDPPPMPADHRLRLGIDGDSGWEQEELTAEELAEARAAGAAVPQPTYAQPPSEPSRADQPSEPSEDVDEESSDNVYVGGTRAPVYRHHVREEARDEAEPDRPREPKPVAQPHRGPRR